SWEGQPRLSFLTISVKSVEFSRAGIWIGPRAPSGYNRQKSRPVLSLLAKTPPVEASDGKPVVLSADGDGAGAFYFQGAAGNGPAASDNTRGRGAQGARRHVG